MSANAAFAVGLALGLFIAANVWIWRYAAGYRAGIKYCLGALEPTVELLNTFEGALAPTSDLRHHVSEEMRLRMAAQAQAEEGEGETRD